MVEPTSLSRHLLTAPPTLAAGDVISWLTSSRARAHSFESPLERAAAMALTADRLGFAFAAGYQCAFAAMFPTRQGGVYALCATEEDGNHPRAIRTRLERAGEEWVVSGHKKFATMGPLATELLVIASVGDDSEGRNRLRLVTVPANAKGVVVRPMKELPFVPEIPHAEVTFEGVRCPSAAADDADAYHQVLKPFRTVEDIHVHAALLGYVIGVARRSAWPEHALERLVALVGALRSAAMPASLPEGHVALAGVLGLTRALLDELDAHWDSAPPEERDRWRRDRALLEVAGKAREARRLRAWELLAGGNHTELISSAAV